MDKFHGIDSEFINVIITSSHNENHLVERRFKKEITILEFKNKLELLVGCQSKTMKLEVYNKNDEIVCKPNEDDKTLGSYPIDDGMRIHVIDNEQQTEDLSEVQKFELSEEEYAKRPDTLKAFLQQNKLGKYNAEEAKRREDEKKKELQCEEQLISAMKLNDRCEVSVPGNPKRRATVMYIGKTDFKPGWWVGVKYDEPFGKNNGSVSGKKYFECPDKYGGFVKPASVVVGDFPEEDDLNEEL